MGEFRVVIAGGGIAGVEGLLRLRRLADVDVHITVVDPHEDVVYRPLTVGEPFALGSADRFPLGPIVASAGADLVCDSVSSVDIAERIVRTANGVELPYDALLIAAGARSTPAFQHVSTFTDADAEGAYLGIVRDIEQGYVRSVALLVPEGPAWPLPIYELALMTSERARSMGIDDLEISLVTPEPEPLAVFGGAASQALKELLHDAGVTVFASSIAQVPAAGHVIVQPGAVELRPQSIVAMPHLSGPPIRGIKTGDAQGFIPIDKHCVVPGTGDRVFAAGDATAFPVKHGGLGAQQADTAAAGIARLAGVDVEESVFKPVACGMLLTGGDPLYLKARVIARQGFLSEVFSEPPWPADQKIVAEELGPYLRELADARA